MIAAPASAWELCNETSYVIQAATVGPSQDDPETLISGGWVRVRPGTCETADFPNDSRRFVFAESSTAHLGGIREWAGSFQLCDADGEDNPLRLPREACVANNLDGRRFFPVAPGEAKTTFVEPADFGTRAETAGLQRLLGDNGFTISAIDGYSGRQTRNALTEFLNTNNVSLGSSTADKIDALERRARTFQKKVGLTVCNRAPGNMWVALGHREADDWVSKGWWYVNAGDCLQPYTRRLKGADMHLFAVLETDDAEHPIEDASEAFCISDVRFTAYGREACESNGYDTVSFRNLEATDIGITLNLSGLDFGLEDSEALRR